MRFWTRPPTDWRVATIALLIVAAAGLWLARVGVLMEWRPACCFHLLHGNHGALRISF